MSRDLEILRADPQDHELLTEIARASKSYWGYPESRMATWNDQLRITPKMIEKYQVFKAILHGQTAAFYVLVIQAEKAVLDHLWVRPEVIGGGVGRALFKHAIRTAAALGARQVEIESEPNALGFYLKMGAHQVGIRTSVQKRELPVLIMKIQDAIL